MRSQIQLPAGASGRQTGLVFTTKDLDNVYPQQASSPQDRSQFMLRGAPGLGLWQSGLAGACRGQLATKDALYSVMGGKLYRFRTVNGNQPEDESTALSLSVAGGEPVSMAWNGAQLAISAGGKGYIYMPFARVFVEITDGDFLTPGDVTYMDGYFIWTAVNSNVLFHSELNEGRNYNELDRIAINRTEGDLVGVNSAFSELWAFSDNSVELLRNVGAAQPAFQPLNNTVFEIGCVSKDSIVRVPAVGMMWLAPDGMVYARGELNKVVTPYEIAEEIAAYSRINDAEAWTYTYGRHRFYVLSFPAAGQTWVYDIAEDAWHKRSTYGQATYRGRFGVMYDRKIVAGDRATSNLYGLDEHTFTDGGEAIRRSFTTPPIHADSNGLVINSLYLILETGTQVPTGNVDLTIEVSSDNGLNFQTIQVEPIAPHGNYRNFHEVKGLGFFESTAVIRVSTAAECQFKVVAAYINVDGGVF